MDDAFLVSSVLTGETAGAFEVQHVETVAAATEILAREDIDLVLLDLNLPDSDGLDSYRRVAAVAHDLPVVILTGQRDEALMHRTLEAGARDYLVKGEAVTPWLARFVAYELEQRRLQRALQGERERRELDHGLAMRDGVGPDLTAEVRMELALEYREIVLQYVRAVHIRDERPVERVRALCERLAGHGARARDLVRLHLDVVRQFSPTSSRAAQQGRLLNDARLVLLELMGGLVDLYGEEAERRSPVAG